jgi:hypothetical protein
MEFVRIYSRGKVSLNRPLLGAALEAKDMRGGGSVGGGKWSRRSPGFVQI